MIPNYHNSKGTPIVDMPALVNMWQHSGKLLSIYIRDVFKEINREDSPSGKIRDKCIQEIWLFLKRRINDDTGVVKINNGYSITEIVNGLANIFENYPNAWFAKVYEDQGAMNSNVWYFNPYSHKYSFSNGMYIRNANGNVICLYPIEFITGAWYSAKSNKDYRKDTLEYMRPYERYLL